MATAEVHYVIVNPEQQADLLDELKRSLESVEAPLGEDQIPVDQKVESIPARNSVLVKFSREIIGRTLYAEVQEDAEGLRREIEGYFPKDISDLLSAKFAGMGFSGSLERE